MHILQCSLRRFRSIHTHDFHVLLQIDLWNGNDVEDGWRCGKGITPILQKSLSRVKYTTMALIQSETDVWIMLYYMALTFCVIILLAQIVGICYNTSRLKALHHESWVSKQGATTKILVSLFTTYSCSIIGIALSISRLGNQFYDPILCEHTYMLSFMAFVTAKLCNYYFFLQRYT